MEKRVVAAGCEQFGDACVPWFYILGVILLQRVSGSLSVLESIIIGRKYFKGISCDRATTEKPRFRNSCKVDSRSYDPAGFVKVW